MKFGHFDDTQREYVIDRPDTPLPWINYLGAQDYFALISNTGGGYSFYKDARLRRLTRYRYNNVPLDQGGRYLYLRDAESGEFWSATWQPTRTELDAYECRHGMGYTRISTLAHGIRANTRYFVPLDETLEIWDLTLTNESDRARQLDLFSYVEFALWDAQDDASNFQRNLNIGEVEVEDGVIYHKTEYRERRDHYAYFACSQPIVGYDTQREAFLGPYGNASAPAVVQAGAATNSHAHGWAPVGAHHIKLELAPGESVRLQFILGYAENLRHEKWADDASQVINKHGAANKLAAYFDAAAVDAAFAALRAYWDQLLGIYQTDTPDEHTNRMVNIWNAYQCMVTFNMSRSASFFESGMGRGLGFRDSNQDLLGFVHMVPERARERLLDIAATQLPSGGAYHQYQPLTKRGNHLVGGEFNDDPLWLVLAACAYIRETGDTGVLAHKVPFDNQPGSETPLLDHLERSIAYTLERLGPHQLPLIGRADWNDCLNLNTFSEQPGESFQTTGIQEGGVAESVFIAGLFIVAAEQLRDLYGYLGDQQHAQRLEQHAMEMRNTLLEHGWDGAWFRRAYDAFGDPVGSAQNEEGQLFIESQGMSVLAHAGVDDGRARQALDAVAERLATEHGIVLHQPAYTRYYLKLGEISSYPPGYKENASVFCHTNPWIMIAETILGDGDAAFSYYQRINPSFREAISEQHRCEPYVYAQTIAGRDAPTFGEAKNSWLTGTAAWNYVAITQHILGIRAGYDHLVVDPVIPADWPGFTASRRFRGITFHITVERGPEPGVYLDGACLPDTHVPLDAVTAGTADVRVVLAAH